MYSNSPEMHRNKTNTIGKLNLQFSQHSKALQLLLITSLATSLLLVEGLKLWKVVVFFSSRGWSW